MTLKPTPNIRNLHRSSIGGALTTAGTWMAKELLKFGLEELIVLWDNPQQVWHTIATVVASPEIRRKLAIMGTEYKKTQSGPSFAYNLERILDTIRLNSFI